MSIYFRRVFELTGSSRTDAGVHAFQNFLHFDSVVTEQDLSAGVYNMNAILPDDIVIRSVRKMSDAAHCRFDAISRTYQYTLYKNKDPFVRDRAFYYPFPLDIKLLQAAAEIIKRQTHFESFAKKNSQVHTFNCQILESSWLTVPDGLMYRVEANRFLRGMVRGLTGTMLKVGRGRMSLEDFEKIFAARSSAKVEFSVPAHGLTLQKVRYPLSPI